MVTHIFNAQQDWHVGVGLWKAMGDESHKKCDETHHQHGPVHSGDNQPSSHPQSSENGTNAKPNDDTK